MKKIICIILTAAMFLLSSCSTTITISTNTETPKTTENIPITVPIYEVTETTEPKPTEDLKSVRYTISTDGGTSGFLKSDDIILDHNGNPITFDSVPFDHTKLLEYGKFTIQEVSSSKKISLNGTEYKLDYVETYRHHIVKDEQIFVSHYEFSDDSVKIKAEFIEEDIEDRLIAFSCTLKNNEEKGNFTVEEAVRKAKEYLSSLHYYKTNIDKYVLLYITKSNGTISLAYNCGDTGEELYIDFDSMGRIVSFDIKSNRIFEPQDVDLFMEKIENARKAVEAALADGYKIKGSIDDDICIDPDTGEMIKIVHVFKDEIAIGIYSLYVNID